MDVYALLACGLATWSAVEIFHHGSIFAGVRAYWESQLGFGGVRGWLASLLSCPFCLSVWVAAATCVSWEVSVADQFSTGRCLICTLAASRLANLGNDLAYSLTRTPGRHELPTSGSGFTQEDER
jgi:hypothetical protein